MINNFCDLQPEFPIVSDQVYNYWEEIETKIIQKEKLSTQLTPEEAFAKIFIEYAAKSDKTRQEKCDFIRQNDVK